MSWLRDHWLYVVAAIAAIWYLRKRDAAARAEQKRLEGEAARQAAAGRSIGEASRLADHGIQQTVIGAVGWATPGTPTLAGAVDVSEKYGWGWWHLPDGGYVNIETGEALSPGTSPINVQNAYDRGEMERPYVDIGAAVTPVADDRGLVVF